MMPDHTVVQFVCFETPLPRAAFVPGWVPFAGTFLAQGLRHIVLSERVGRRGAGPSFDFISRNEWPEGAFARAVRAGRIGDGTGGSVRATQGGTFRATEAVPPRAQPDHDKVMALLRVPDRDPLVLGRAIAEVFAATPDTRLSLYRDAVAEHQRFDLVAEAYGNRGQGGEMAARLERAIAGAVDPNQSAVGIYRKALALPLPPPTL